MRTKAAVVLVLVLGAVGCSDGDDDLTNDAGSPSVEAWCEAFTETTSPDLDPEDNVAFDRLVDVAPGEIREASEVLRSFSLGDSSLGESSADLAAADAEVRAYAGTHC